MFSVISYPLALPQAHNQGNKHGSAGKVHFLEQETLLRQRLCYVSRFHAMNKIPDKTVKDMKFRALPSIGITIGLFGSQLNLLAPGLDAFRSFIICVKFDQ